ncbi:pyrophosphate--fructose 6-phosphate 1-phosphotransferase [Anaerocolumna cellulosilytica]|uniref:Pyrophosphate--fructose 6-phosphate 1-phosphotransferase n=1 Tax=Anaerocolumna cellulosilytica TaxID=433286 RepID=A0A6S6RBI9_9FIRM|nr:6-phosphofructokinase [Anaerocolumna cellulosilytica]MBB5195870.1 6-phosphofructokinase 1 [Anaerocolumna cellulosilytica]BCJ96880.1 pyrophosphate--fructose 6-phosphate 1-phosphotransferase [Anaerocolumna cellulosilytica]
MTGNVLVGQSGGPTAVINSSLAGVFKTAKDLGAGKVYGMLYGIQGLLDEKYIDLGEKLHSELEIELLKRTPSSYLGSCRYKLPDYDSQPEIYETLFNTFNKLNIQYFFYIGGNDSMDTIKKLSDYGTAHQSEIRFIGVPKTIDNDLEITDHTPGYGSAAKFIGATTKEIIRDSLVYDQKNVTIIEIMGRNVGWLTGAAALSEGVDCGGPDLIYLPETDFSMEDFLERTARLQAHKKSLVIAISEGIHLKDGRYVCELTEDRKYVDGFGHTMLNGAANILAQRAAREIGCKTRAIELNTLQRCASHMASLVDIKEAFLAGAAGVRAADEGKSGEMIILKRTSGDSKACKSIYECSTDTFDIHKIANMEKKVPLEWIDLTNNKVTKDFVDYARPLIGDELSPIMVEGLPRHIEYVI